ncbi:MAG: hypothetical protein EBU90_13405 [Proteobacteria bacterium]|nr:hypothetical protein [Pseudomonadota bacterium]
MSLIFFEGFDNCSSFKDVSGIFNISANMLDDPRTIHPVLSSGYVNGINPKNSGNMIVLESSYSTPSTSGMATIANNQSINITGSGNSSSKFTITNNFSYTDSPIFRMHKNGIFNIDIGDIRFTDTNGDLQILSVINITRTRNGISTDTQIYRDGDIYNAGNKFIGSVPVKSGDFVSIKEKNLTVVRTNTNAFTAWAVETSGVFFPSINIDLGKNLTQGVVGFSYAPILPPSGDFGNGTANFTPIACLTDDQYRPHFFICNTSSGKVQIRKFDSSNFINNNNSNTFYNYKIGSANTDGSQQIQPAFLRSTTDPSLSIGGTGTNLTLISESALEKNTLVNNFWNYIELKFDMITQDLALRINRKNTSTKNDLEFNGLNINSIISSSNPLIVGSGSYSGSGTYESPYVVTNPSSGVFRVNENGIITLRFVGTWRTNTSPPTPINNFANIYKNGTIIQNIPKPPGSSFFPGFYESYSNSLYSFPVSSGDIIGIYWEQITNSSQSAFFSPDSSLSDQLNKNVRYLVLGTMWGQDINSVSPAAHLGWKTLLDDIYVVDTSGSVLPNDFLGSVSCRRIPFNQQVKNTTSSGNLASVSDVLSGASGFATPSGNGTLFFDAVNQEFNVKSSGFSVNNNNIIGLQINMNGFSLNTEDYIGVGLEIANGSGSYDFSPVVLSRNSTTGGYARGQLYTTNPSGLPWTEEAIRNTTFKLKSLSE